MCGTYSDPDLIQQFVLEARDLLQSIEQDLIALELSPGDDQILNRMFRALHTIKGTSAFLGIEPAAHLSHCAEDVLSGLRGREVQFTRRTTNLLLAARDQLGQMVDDLDRGATPIFATDNLLTELERCSQPKISDTSARDDLERQTPAVSSVAPSDVHGSLMDSAPAANPTAADIELSSATQTMRLDVRKLDDLISLVGELVLERNRLLQLVSAVCSESLDEDSPLARTAARISSVTQELQSATLRTRMVPIHSVFSEIPRLVRDLSLSLQKEVELAVSGQDVEIDRTLAELLSGPLVHLVRNALDHGIELPAERELAGKPYQGRVCVEAKQAGNRITIAVSDDGAGMDPLRILGKAIEQNIVAADEAAHLSEREILDLVFIPGFSTAGTVGGVSRRGIGMDVVRTAMKQANGSVELRSQPGRGTTVLLHLPLTVAILPVLLVHADTQVFALPLHSVVETARASSETLHGAAGVETVRLRDETLPLIRLQSWCASPQHASPTDPEYVRKPDQKIVVMIAGEERVALLVDRLSGQESTVIKPLSPSLRDCRGIAGSTIGGDGRVRLVLDPAGLVSWAANPRQDVLQ